jgi:two-component sensor histidine kinase/Tfp pilus assembly protein PilF
MKTLPFLFSLLFGIVCQSIICQKNTTLIESSEIQAISFLLDSVDLYLGSNPRIAMPFVDQADSICDIINNEDQKFRVLFNRALVLRNSGKHKESLELFEEYITFQKIKNDSVKLNNGYKVAGALYTRTQEFDKSEAYLKQALSYYKEIKWVSKIGGTLKNLGSLYRRKGEYSEAIKYYFKALGLIKDSKDLRNVANIHNSLGVLYAQLEDFKNAKVHLLKSLKINERRNDKMKQGNGLMNLASIDPDQSQVIEFFKRGLKIFKELKLDKQIANCNFNLANAYVKVGQYKKALPHYNDAYDFNQKNPSRRLLELQQEIAKVHALTGNKTKSISYLNKSIKELPEIKEPYLLSKGYRSIAHTYSILGDYKNAYEYNQLHEVLKDSLMSVSKQEQITKIETTYKVKEKNLEIESLNLKTELSNVQLKKQRFTIGGLLVFLAILSLLFYRMYLQKKKINQQHEEKELLLKEIHHRVKNNLQVISSLLGIQYRSIKDDKAKKAIQEGRTRVHSMALIHQDLYKTSNLAGIDMKSYLTKLCHDLFKTYKISESDIELITEIESITLDVDSVIPIGLILNELITNALKYAFPNNRSGKIVIKFKEINNMLNLTVSDNGVGFNTDKSDKSEKSFGHTLIRAFKTKLDANVSIVSKDGTTVKMTIKKYAKLQAA